MSRDELEAHAARLELELRGAHERTKTHFAARTEAERERDSAAARGVRNAINWIRAMPRRQIATARVAVGPEIYQLVAMSVARYLEERLEADDEVTRPELPPSSSGE
jgi:hypothetical protein